MKKIIGYEYNYEVSTTGEVWALERTIINIRGNPQRYPRRCLKPDSAITGHQRVTLSLDGVTKKHSVHRLVAQAYIDNTMNKPDVNHIDNDPTNNNVSNLEWCTHSENMKHAQVQGRLTAAQSKGGREIGTVLHKKYRDVIGMSFNSFTVVSISARRKSKQYFNVICTCGYETTRTLTYMKNASGVGCIKCKVKI